MSSHNFTWATVLNNSDLKLTDTSFEFYSADSQYHAILTFNKDLIFNDKSVFYNNLWENSFEYRTDLASLKSTEFFVEKLNRASLTLSNLNGEVLFSVGCLPFDHIFFGNKGEIFATFQNDNFNIPNIYLFNKHGEKIYSNYFTSELLVFNESNYKKMNALAPDFYKYIEKTGFYKKTDGYHYVLNWSICRDCSIDTTIAIEQDTNRSDFAKYFLGDSIEDPDCFYFGENVKIDELFPKTRYNYYTFNTKLGRNILFNFDIFSDTNLSLSWHYDKDGMLKRIDLLHKNEKILAFFIGLEKLKKIARCTCLER